MTYSLYYYEQPLIKLLKEIKYRHRPQALNYLLESISLAEWEQTQVIKQIFSQPIISYIPLSNIELKIRGFNQAEIIAQYMSKKLALPWFNLLIKPINTKKQSMLKKYQRRENIKKAFLINKINTKDYQTIILVDDVITSGATINEGAKLLKKYAKVKIVALSLFRAN